MLVLLCPTVAPGQDSIPMRGTGDPLQAAFFKDRFFTGRHILVDGRADYILAVQITGSGVERTSIVLTTVPNENGEWWLIAQLHLVGRLQITRLDNESGAVRFFEAQFGDEMAAVTLPSAKNATLALRSLE